MPEKASEGVYNYGKGQVFVIRQDPKEFAMQENGDKGLLATIEKAYGRPLNYKNHYYLERGPYVLASVVDENAVSNDPLVLNGSYIDLFDPTLPCLTQKTIKPGEQAFLFNIDAVQKKNRPQVLASASRQYEEQIGKKSFSFIAKSPIDTDNVMRILLPREPKQVKVSVPSKSEWDSSTRTLLLGFENNPDGVKVDINW